MSMYEQEPLFEGTGGQEAPSSPPVPFVPQPVFQQPVLPPPTLALKRHKPQRTQKQNNLLSLSVLSSVAAASLSLIIGAYVLGSNTSENVTVNVNTSQETTTEVANYTDVVNNTLPSVVTVGMVADTGAGTGSGVVLDAERGYVITNAHVVEAPNADAVVQRLVVRTVTGDTFEASLVGIDVLADIAVIKVDGGLPGTVPVTFSQEEVSVGDTTIAIGSPLGLAGTVTTGVVSAVNRPVSLTSAQGEALSISAIQTDASINSGNSGGGLFNNAGQLIGINAAISSTDTSTGSIGIGYAIPSPYVLRIATELIETGVASHVTLGINVGDSVDSSGIFSIGAVVGEITPGSPAEGAGIKSGDVIVALDGNRVESATQLVAMIRQVAPGEEVVLTVRSTNQDPRDINIRL